MSRVLTRAAVLVLAAATAWPASAPAQSGGAYALRWSTLGGGGAFTSGGSYGLGGTIGQAHAGPLAAGGYQVHGGFWTPGTQPTVDAPPPADLVPARFAAYPPAPNPSRSGVSFVFDLSAPSTARVSVYDLAGRQVRTLLARERGAGRHTANWDGADAGGRRVSAGIYFARIEAGPHLATFRFVRID